LSGSSEKNAASSEKGMNKFSKGETGTVVEKKKNNMAGMGEVLLMLLPEKRR